MICPFSFFFLLILFWIAYKLFSKKENLSKIIENFLITSLITFFFFQSSIIIALADLLNCTKIENDYYLSNYLLEKCEGNINYVRWTNFMIIPSFCFFSLILTIMPFIYMFRNR